MARPGTFKKGQSGNPKGRPKSGFSKDEFIQAIKDKGGKKARKPLLDHLIDRAYEDDRVLIGVVNKLLPDLSKVDHGFEDSAKELLGHISNILEASRSSARKRGGQQDT